MRKVDHQIQTKYADHGPSNFAESALIKNQVGKTDQEVDKHPDKVLIKALEECVIFLGKWLDHPIVNYHCGGCSVCDKNLEIPESLQENETKCQH